MLKQSVKRINAEFILTHALSHLSFLQFKPYAFLFLGLLLSLMLMSISKKTLYYLENHSSQIGKPYTGFVLVVFTFIWTFYTVDDFLRLKKRINKALSRQSKQFLLLFCVLV